ncbi:MAG: hypothetical protein AUJ72_01325 [Candidatus Omnitrophica bacterium CG1_02_46_14]|nr:MAG: hypothetical protein AUJ72_01325 [Candidatus Omnitrophica bacterium CG1_02_46_14]
MYLISADQDLKLYRECERCFWLKHKNLIPRPKPEPSVFESAARQKLHDYYDRYRGKLPPDLLDQLDGVLLDDQELISHWRDWHKGLRHSDTVMSAVLCGALDDCLVRDKEIYTPILFRMMSREPYLDEIKPPEMYMDSLIYLLTTNGYKTLEYGYVICYYPQTVAQHRLLELKTKVVRVDADLMRVEKYFYEAANLLRGKALPEVDKDCSYCARFNARVLAEKHKK